MSRRKHRPPSHGKHRKRKYAAHKRATSPETRRWEDEHLIPRCPPWLAPETYVKLADLRRSL